MSSRSTKIRRVVIMSQETYERLIKKAQENTESILSDQPSSDATEIPLKSQSISGDREPEVSNKLEDTSEKLKDTLEDTSEKENKPTSETQALVLSKTAASRKQPAKHHLLLREQRRKHKTSLVHFKPWHPYFKV